MSYQNELKVINQNVCGVTDWLWVKEDTSSWPSSLFWEVGHYDKYLRYLKKRDLVVTAGANCGLHARMYADIFKTVYAFEPESLNFHCLVNNCQMDNVIKIMGALGSENGISKLLLSSPDQCGSHRMDFNSIEENTVPVFTIDSFNFPQCDLIQLDAEGSEPQIIKGAINTISKHRPIVIMETVQEIDYPECAEILTGLDYARVDISYGDSIWQPLEDRVI